MDLTNILITIKVHSCKSLFHFQFCLLVFITKTKLIFLIPADFSLLTSLMMFIKTKLLLCCDLCHLHVNKTEIGQISKQRQKQLFINWMVFPSVSAQTSCASQDGPRKLGSK